MISLVLNCSMDYYFSNSWSVKTKLIYDRKGWDNGFIEDDFGSYITDYNLDYLTVPVLASWHFGNNKNWFLEFGPYVGFLLNAEEVRFGTDVTDSFNSTDFGLALGIGVSRAASKGKGSSGGFGIILLASALPVFSVLALGIVLNTQVLSLDY